MVDSVEVHGLTNVITFRTKICIALAPGQTKCLEMEFKWMKTVDQFSIIDLKANFTI
jgi:hypothetical protein